MKYRREIDGLRAVAVVPVVFFHAGLASFAGGFVGVDIFFVISGYLITSIIIKEQAGDGFSLVHFYERRARRILPALFFVLAVSVIGAVLVLPPGAIQEFGRSLGATVLFSSNILFWRESGYFAAPAELKPLLHTWSLAVEEQYYLFYPLLLMLMAGMRRRVLLVSLAFAAVASLLLSEWASVYRPTGNFFLLPTRGWELLIGAFAAFYLFDRPLEQSRRPRWLSEAMSLVGLALIAFAMTRFDANTRFPSFVALVPTVGTVLIILFASPQTLTGRALGSAPLVGLGLVSYSLYLWHQPLFAFARWRLGHDPGLTVFLVASLIALGMAVLSWRYVESPFRDRHRMTRRTIFAGSLAGIVVFLGVAIAIEMTDGLKQRFDYPGTQMLQTTAEFSEFVPVRFTRADGRAFDAQDPREKLLIIGDSFGEDIVNVIEASPLIERFQYSTHRIAAKCGNLLLEDYSVIDRYVTARCRREALGDPRYNPDVLARAAQADQVWLVSSWRDWQVDLLPETLARLDALTDARLLLIGRKKFDAGRLTTYLDMPPATRATVREPQADFHVTINDRMRQTLPEKWFLDLNDLYCNEQGCRFFDDNGDLLSHDGAHLTAEGVGFFAPRFYQRFIRLTEH